MRPSEIYAMPTLSEEGWVGSEAIEVMFGREHTGKGVVDAQALPLRVLTKLSLADLDIPAAKARWQVVTWEGEPLGVVVTSCGGGERFVTDAAAHRRALLRLVGLAPLPRVSPADEDAFRLERGGGHVLIREGETYRAHPRLVCAGDVSLVDVDALAGRIARVSGWSSDAPPMGEVWFQDAVLASVNPALRRTADYDVAAMRVRMRSMERGWVGPLVATEDGTYLVCVRPESMSLPIGRALCVTRMGSPDLIDELATGVVHGPEVEQSFHTP